MARYRVRRGDTINSIAERAGISREDFIRLNPGLDTRWEIELAAQEGWAVRLGEGNSIGGGAGTDTTLAYVEVASGDYRRSDVQRTQTSQSPILTEEQKGIPPSPWTDEMQAEADASIARTRDDEYVDMMQEYVPGYTGYVPGSPEDAAAREEHGFPPYGEEAGGANEPLPGGANAEPDTDVSGDNPDTTAGNAGEGGGYTEQDQENLMAAVEGSFPWINSLPGLRDFIWGIIQSRPRVSTAAIISEVRNNWDGYDGLFPNIRREDGSMRMNEGTYLSTLDGYRRTLGRFGLAEQYSNAQLSEFLANEIDVNELQDRLTIFDRIQRGGHDLKVAMYVYGGISLSDDDLYDMVVDPSYAGEVSEEYWANAQELDYPTFLGRAADVVTQTTGTVVDRETTVTVLDQLLHGGDPSAGEYLSLVELEAAFEAAMVGSAATMQGLALPDFEDIEQFRMAGINRSAALQRYGEFARDRDFLNAVVSRRDMGGFSQENFEAASFLSNPDQQRRLQRGLAQEAARASGGASFGFGQSQGRIQQAGMTAFRN